MSLPRIALIHFHLESNRAAPVSDRKEFEAQRLLIGEELAKAARQTPPRVSSCTKGFLSEMGDFDMVPIFSAAAGAGGMMDGALFDELLAEIDTRLPKDLDAIYVDAHGACIATNDEDPEGTLLQRIRAKCGCDIPLVMTLDLHGHVSPTMIELADFISAYRTNPHIDQFERGAEAAIALKRLLAGETTGRALVRLPFIPPSTSQNTDTGPYARLMGEAIALSKGDVWNVSLCSGFTAGDSQKAGFNVTVTACDSDTAKATATEMAARVWQAREEFSINLTSIEDSIDLMKTSQTPLIFGDVADNPGGGGRGNVLALFEAMLEAGVQKALVGMLFDPTLAAQAQELGEGAEFDASFNREESSPLSGKLTRKAKILKVRSAPVECRRGLYAGGLQNLGPCALLDCNGIYVIVSTIRRQLCDPAFIERFDLDIADFKSVIVKSRGHFRAGFDEFFAPEQVIEVDGPGLTTPVLARMQLNKTPRPIYPADKDMQWSPEQSCWTVP
ncbi:MAG: M81 family metallopeptidase [Cohaesibacter sp.]|nr:M81 family metallopeptidase [Cohaesibacter sp.]